jgi:hypothetical protein
MPQQVEESGVPPAATLPNLFGLFSRQDLQDLQDFFKEFYPGNPVNPVKFYFIASLFQCRL